MVDLSAKFDKNIRPLHDAVDKLRNLKVTNEGISLPSIVVVGDQSSGKSSVLESLATINLPRGQGIATRVPLVLRLVRCRHSEESLITISYKDIQAKAITEDEIKSEVDAATYALAGAGKGVLTEGKISLHIRKPDAPALTMIDLPGITRVPVHGQPADIYEQIKAMIQRYLKPKETVILNVLSATVDFSTCESIRMSQEEDKKGERTLAVVTKVDRAPNDVYEKGSADDVNIGLGYICVRLNNMFQEFSDKLHQSMKDILPETKTEDILLRMSEMRGLTLPNFLSPALLQTLVSEEIDKVSEVCTYLVPQTHDYAREFVFDIIDRSTSGFTNLNAAYRDCRERSCTMAKYVRHVVDKERSNVFTMNDYYMANVEKIRQAVTKFKSGLCNDDGVKIEGFEKPFVLQEIWNKWNDYQSAFDMKVNLAAYCKVVHKRMADEIPLELRYALDNALLRSLWSGLLKANMGQDLPTLMEENASTRQKRLTLLNRVVVLKECKKSAPAVILGASENKKFDVGTVSHGVRSYVVLIYIIYGAST